MQANRDLLLHGLGLFGGRGENTARLKVFRVQGNAGDPDEQNVELVAETDEALFDCPPKQTAFVGLRRPVPINADVWYIAWVQIQ